MVKKIRKSKGFTLVELLIVIIIIGILAGMMMLSSGAATDKAEATKIVSDLRNIKAAALMFYADTGNWPSDDLSNALTASGGVAKYLDTVPNANYKIKAGTPAGSLFASYEGLAGKEGIANKLVQMAPSAGLKETSVVSHDSAYALGDTVYMIIKK